MRPRVASVSSDLPGAGPPAAGVLAPDEASCGLVSPTQEELSRAAPMSVFRVVPALYSLCLVTAGAHRPLIYNWSAGAQEQTRLLPLIMRSTFVSLYFFFFLYNVYQR